MYIKCIVVCNIMYNALCLCKREKKKKTKKDIFNSQIKKMYILFFSN